MAFATGAGVFLAAFIQFKQTGEWLGFVKTQKHWDHYLQRIHLPLTTWGDRTYLDGSALVAGLIATVLVARFAWRRLSRHERQSNPAFVFSLAYLSGITLVALLLNGGQLYSLNRHVFASAFAMVAGIGIVRNASFSWKAVLSLFVFSCLILSLFHVDLFTNLTTPILTVATAAYLSSWLLLCSPIRKWSRIAGFGLYSFNVLMQAHLLDGFMSGYWVA
jgi:hypothetical protein